MVGWCVALDCGVYDGRYITVYGAIRLEREEQSICPTKEFLEGDWLNCLWFAERRDWSKDQWDSLERGIVPGQYVRVYGTVDCALKGFGGMWAGAITEVTEIVDISVGRIIWRLPRGSRETDKVGQDQEARRPRGPSRP